jgi:hypothetical protein
MKKSFYASGIATLIAFQAEAQTSETALLASYPSHRDHLYVLPNDLKAKDFPAVVEQNLRNDFKNISNIEWVETPGGYRIYFTQDAFLSAADYTRKGKIYSTIRYGEKLLSARQKSQINFTFDDPQIRQVSEVKMASSPTRVYVVIVEDENSVKTVQLIEGDIQVINEQIKKG